MGFAVVPSVCGSRRSRRSTRWLALDGESFPAPTCGDLERWRDAGTEVHSLVRDPFGGNPPYPPVRGAWDEPSIGDGAR